MANIGPFYIGVDGGPGQPGASSEAGHTLDSVLDKIGFTFYIPKTGTISRVGFWLGTVATGDTLNVSLRTVNGSGFPTSTNYKGSTPGTVAITGSGQTNKSVECALGSPATGVIAGELASLVFNTSNSTGNIQISSMGWANSFITPPNVYLDNNSGGYSSQNRIPQLYLFYSDDSSYRIPFGCFPPGKTNFYTLNQNSTPDELSIQYTAPVDMRLCGAVFSVREFGSTGNIDIDVFDTGSTPASLLNSKSTITHDNITVINGFNPVTLEPKLLSSGQTVNVGLFNTDTSNSLWVRYLDVDSAAHWGDFAQGIGFATRTRTNNTASGGPAFTGISTRRLLGGLVFDQVNTTTNNVTGSTVVVNNVIDPLTHSVPGI